MPMELKAVLENACESYAEIAKLPTAQLGGREFARRSAAVAVAWRRMAAVPGLEWWVVGALWTAAEAYELQARDWEGGYAGTVVTRS
ncbi:hypothetical protein [Actinophytocola oryzae]|uniref:Uncharacterized protein n=1 Tax=Actinophytocola oryzae TaxID=502181 RepID=A0A4R7VXN6_9PSEU|nr:hypothetical protein [Actinophytocola oryzae]TDV54903.1 hypothetical protein CLV71_103144 [Actinophytocola oryzae]